MAVLLVVVVGLLVSGNNFWILIASSAAVAYVFTGSFNVIFGNAGLFSLAHAAIYGAGAYTSVILETTYHWNVVPAALAGMLAGLLAGLLVSLPTARLAGAFLALGTLAFGFAATEVVTNQASVTGGPSGFLGIEPVKLFGHDFVGGTIDYYWLAAAAAVVCFVIFRRLDRSAVGRRFVALRESEIATQAAGINPITTRMLAFCISGLLAGFAGVLNAHLTLFISPDTFSLDVMIQVLIVTLLGGAGYLLGPVFGVAALVAINQGGQRLGDASPLLFGAAIIVVVSFAPTGLVGLGEQLWRRFAPSGLRRGAATAGDGAATTERLKVRPAASHGDLRVEHVELKFQGVTAIRDLSFHINAGEVLGLIGPNGAGKTSVVNVITGRVRPNSGSVFLGDEDLVGRKPYQVARRGVVRTFQTTQLVPTFDLVTNVMLGRDRFAKAGVGEQIVALPRSRNDDALARERAMDLLAHLGIADSARLKASEVPYGILRRAEIAKAMALEPAFLLLDEPGAGLSSYERDEITVAIHAVADAGIGCLLIDHNISFVANACRRLIVLANGELLAEGPTEEVLSHDQVIAAYLGRVAVA